MNDWIEGFQASIDYIENNLTEELDIGKIAKESALSPFYYHGAMLSRNRYMADRSSLCICWLSNMRSGTASAVRYAIIHNQMKVINLALQENNTNDRLREKTWNYIYTSPSADKNAITAPLRLLRDRKLTFKNT